MLRRLDSWKTSAWSGNQALQLLYVNCQGSMTERIAGDYEIPFLLNYDAEGRGQVSSTLIYWKEEKIRTLMASVK